MPPNTKPIFPLTPYMNTASLAAATACTTRGAIAHASLGLTPCFAVELCPVSTNGRKIRKIQIQAISTAITAPTVAQTVLIWRSNGVTAYVIDEIQVSAQTPSVSSPAFSVTKTYDDFVLPAGDSLYASTTVTTTAATTALAVTVTAGDY